MNELLMKRIERRLAGLSDEQGYRVLDYVEFLDSKYGNRDRRGSVLNRLAEGVEDTMRAGRVPVAAIRGTMSAVDSASRVMDRLAKAGRSAVEELGKTLAGQPQAEVAGPESAEPEPPSTASPPAPPSAAGEPGEEPAGSG